MRACIILALVCALWGAALCQQHPQGYSMYLYIWSIALNGELSSGECCDFTSPPCGADCDVHFVVCVRDHGETADNCNSTTSSYITFISYAYLDTNNITFPEDTDVFGAGIDNPVEYNFTGPWSRHIQIVLVVRDYDINTGAFYHIDYITADWIVSGNAALDRRTYPGFNSNINVHMGLEVDCWEGWYGEFCSIFCIPQDAPGGHYDCLDNGTKQCLPNWTGNDCNFMIDCIPSCPENRVCYNGSCDPAQCDNPCENGGTCVNGSCSCTYLYTGINCTEQRDICGTVISPSDCPVGQGVCSNLLTAPNGYVCTCVTGYSGTTCDQNIDDCDHSMCGDKGTCVDQVNGYECVCDAGYTGTHCDEEVDECESSPCMHGGVCTDGVNSYTCSCSNGYTGLDCGTDVYPGYPQGYYVYLYIRAITLNGELSNGECCDSTSHPCGADCDVHFVVCVRDHGETSNNCNSTTSSYVTFFSYAYLDTNYITFTEGDNVFGTGIHNPVPYYFTGSWSRHIQTVLIVRDYDLSTADFYSIDYITVDWIVSSDAGEDRMTYNGYFNNTDVDIGLSVECFDGWYGEYCTVSCIPQDAPGGHYDCLDNGTKVCLENWSGLDCNFMTVCIPSCPVSRVCYNGSCDSCSQGYSGDNCTCTQTHICDPAGGHCDYPCQNGGSCTGGVCECSFLYTGQDCSQQRDICGSYILPSDCPTGQGVCHNYLEAPNGYVCVCEPGYTGDKCNENINDCATSPCGEKGTCVDEINGYDCLCDPGYMGTHCEVNIDECLSSPCLNGGVCTEGENSFTCDCPTGTFLPICELTPECTRATCNDNGECQVDEDQSTYCVCDDGFTGSECDVIFVQCELDSCPSGYSCTDGIGEVSCICDVPPCDDIVVAGVGNQNIPSTALIAGGMGIIIGVLLVVVVLVIIIAVCFARRKKTTRRGTIQPDIPAGAFSNPIYDEGNLPTYEDLDNFNKKVNPAFEPEPEYETMEAYKVDLSNVFLSENTYVDEKKVLENMYN